MNFNVVCVRIFNWVIEGLPDQKFLASIRLFHWPRAVCSGSRFGVLSFVSCFLLVTQVVAEVPNGDPPFVLKPTVGLSKVATPGVYFRVTLMLSPKFAHFFGDAKEQIYVRSLAMQRMSLRQDDLAELVSNVTPATSEAEAEEIFKNVRRIYVRNLEDTELELRTALNEAEYNQILTLQLGLCGIAGFSDPEIRDWLGVNDEQKLEISKVEKKTAANQAKGELNKGDRVLEIEVQTDMQRILTASQFLTYKQAMIAGEAFREKEALKAKECADLIESPDIPK